MNIKQLIADYQAGPALLRKAVTGLTPDQLHARPIPGKWSTLECVAHLADFEPIHASRMKYVIAHDRPLLVDGDEVRFAQSLAYQDRDLDEELAIIEMTRREMTRILQSLPDEAALRVGIHTYRGLVTLQDLLAAAVNHIPHHVKFIEEKRQALGV